MTLEEFLDRHRLKAIPADQPFPEELCPYDEHCGDEYRFFVNDEHTVGLGLNDTNEEIRVVYAEMGLADTGWIPRAEAFAVTSFDSKPEERSKAEDQPSRKSDSGSKDSGR